MTWPNCFDVRGISAPVVYVGLSMAVTSVLRSAPPPRPRARPRPGRYARAPDTPDGQLQRTDMALAAETLNSPQPAIDRMLPRMFAPGLRAGALPEQVTLGMMSSSSARAVADGGRGLGLRADSIPTLATIDVPTLVMVASTTGSRRPRLTIHRRSINGAKLVTIDQSGHMSNLENPEAFNAALLDFVGSLTSR